MRRSLEAPSSELKHELNSIFKDVKQHKSSKTLGQSELFKEHGDEIERVTSGIEFSNTYANKKNDGELRIAAWNIERGRELDGIISFLADDHILQDADVLLITEADIGMGRSGNRNIPKEMAEALGYNYCYGNSFLVLAKGDEGEQDHDEDNTLALHGSAILTRYPIRSVETPVLPSLRDYMRSSEQRLGQRRGLICSIEIEGKLIDFATAHLELKTSPLQRAQQLAAMLRPMLVSGSSAQVFGGDLNTHTYNLHNKFWLLMSFLYKLLYVGVPETIVQYMQPDRYFERPLFEVFRQHGFNVADFNDRRFGTLYYNLGEAAASIKTRKWAPGFIHNWLREILEPYGGEVPFRLDWLAGRGFSSSTAGRVVKPIGIEKPMWNNKRLSDHDPIVVDLKLG